ncbi:MAG TPA: response regulator transcription factor [Myxococcota bacterium]|nr:response regulator transcription factor [Myxococcota bacterium]
MNRGRSPIRVAIVDDHAMIRVALASVLEDDDDIEVIGLGESIDDAERIARESAPDVLVLDYNLPGGGSLPLLEQIARSRSPVRVLVLTVHESVHYAVRAIESGARGFMVKSSAVEELISAIRAVNAGEVYIPPAFSRSVIEHLRQPKRDRVGLASLSPREFELLRLIGDGMGLKEVAHQLGISVSTASTYRARVMEKLNLSSTSDLIRFAFENQLVR